ncbi:hypothetical protein ASZ90_017532 [hydrocarbon metagenome]|uniref:Uncharacterized protein n=1 Tax=hydrocarbon metagenome TaxID=938273 RepID=A0A0W8E9B1_9ZZZZ
MAERTEAVRGQSKGSAVIVAMFVLMVICLIGAAVLCAAMVERKVVISQNRMELLRQAADGGIQVARNIIMNYMAAGQAIPAIDDLYLENGLRVAISCDMNSINDNGVISVTSRAYMEDDYGITATKAVRAELLIGCLPDCVIRASTLKLAGRYLSTVSGKAIDGSGNQDWDVDHTEPRLAGDPDHPSSYPLNGPSYFSFMEKYQINHPYFNIGDQQWPGIPDAAHTWWIDYQYASVGEEGHHDLEHSIIHTTPFYNPYGYLEIVNKEGLPELIGIGQGWNNALTADEENHLFKDDLSNPAWGCSMSEESYQSQVINALLSSCESSVIYPDKQFKSQDFIKTAQVLEVPISALVSALPESYQHLAQYGADWENIAEDSEKLRFNSGKYEVDINSLEQTYMYIDRPVGDTVVLDFNSALIPTDYCLTDWLAGNKATFFDLIKNEGRSVIIVSNADLELTMDNMMFEHLKSGTVFYVISSGNITLSLEPVVLEFPGYPRDVSAFLRSGEDIRIHSAVTGCNYTGLIYADNNLDIRLESLEGIQEYEPYFRLEKDDTIIQHFPQSWTYLGMAPIIAYTYLD